jgi:hypothetical protein
LLFALDSGSNTLLLVIAIEAKFILCLVYSYAHALNICWVYQCVGLLILQVADVQILTVFLPLYQLN